MTITALQAVKSLNALRAIECQPLRFCSALTVCKAILELEPVYAAYAKEETRIVGECALKGKDGNPEIVDGRFTVRPERAQEYIRLRKELDDEPVEWKSRKLGGIECVNIAPNQLADLMCLFDIEGV